MNACLKCKDENVKEEDGICPFSVGDDELPLRCIGFWTKEKLYYLQRYMSIFNSAMKGKWPKRAYVELFAGPGFGIIRDSGDVIHGSPLLAIDQANPFTRYIFVDINPDAILALEKRIQRVRPAADVKFITGDCNSSIEGIKKNIDNSYLILTFIDPTGMQAKFSTIRSLTKDLRMDLIINFPLQAINRSYSYALQGYDQKYDDFFGSKEWKSTMTGLTDMRSIGARLLDLYKNQLRTIGYEQFEDLSNDDILVRGPKNIPLYYLFLASKNEIAHKFWKEIQKIRANSQRQLL